MSLFSWFENLFGGKWTNETVVQYQGDTMEHAFGGYSHEDHIGQLRERRPSLHHTQRLLVDAKIRELEHELVMRRAREEQRAEHKRVEEKEAQVRYAAWEEDMRRKRSNKAAELSKPVSGNVIAKPPKFSVDMDDNAPSVSKARDADSAGWSTHTYTPSNSYSFHSSSHSCSSSSHSSSDSSSSSSDSGGGGCD